MYRLIALAALVAMLGVLPGCLVQDRDHNRQHYATMRQDLHNLHRDIDHFMAWDEPSQLVDKEQAFK